MSEQPGNVGAGGPPLPEFVSFGEALTDMIREGEDLWRAVPGGAPWNVARGMAGLGMRAAFAGAVSCDCFGEALWTESEQAGLDLRFLQRYPRAPLLAIVHETNPPQYFFVGADSADLHFVPEGLPESWEANVAWAYFGGISLMRAPLSSRLLGVAETLKRRGIGIVFDPNFRVALSGRYDEVFARMADLADVIKVSDEDLCGIYRLDKASDGVARLRAAHPRATIFHTRGESVATLYAGSDVWQAVPPQVEVRDTVGAGDFAVAGLLCSVMRRPQACWGEHLRAAVATGTGACTQRGARLPSRALLDRLYDTTRIIQA